jgi:osmotically-inducible protein OsmY
MKATLVGLIVVSALALLTACDMMKKTQLENAVVKALAADPRTKDYKFEVSLDDAGAVTITGEVGLAADIDAVTEIAKKVPGVRSVHNNCKVPEESSGQIQDTVAPQLGF